MFGCHRIAKCVRGADAIVIIRIYLAMNEIVKNATTENQLYQDVKTIIEEARANAIRSVDYSRVLMYWKTGRRIFEEEQKGKDRADYGTYLIAGLALRLEPEFGSGFTKRQLERARQFYRTYPNASALRPQFNWTQYKLLISISDPDKREYYELESVNNCWTARELERQKNSLLYERLLKSNDKEAVLAVARRERIPESPAEVVKDPMYLEFLGLQQKAHYYESELEDSLITHLQEFLMELGNGFLFSDRQKRILIEDDEYKVDLVFYNRILRCFVLIDLKTHKATHQDLGQLQMYVNYYDRMVKLPDESPTIGILLCTEKNDTAVRMTLPKDNTTIVASKYELYLPSTEQLVEEVEEGKREYDRQQQLKSDEEK